MSFLGELKRRNVFRVGIAYAVVAWLVLQLADVVLNNVSAPDWVFWVTLFLLAMGLVIVVVFAWVFEMTPEGLKREKDVDRSRSITAQTGKKLDRLIIGVLVLALAYFVFDKFVLSAQREAAAVQSALESAESAAESAALASEDSDNRSIAVLPFVNMSSDEEQEYFSDGLSEELLNLLAKIPELKVTSRSSAFSFKGKDFKIADVGRELNVANVLEGSVRKAGNQIRVTAQLIRVEDDVHLWSETYDRALEDVFAIQDEIAENVVAQLKLTLLGEAPKAEETDPEAYALYLQGRAAARLNTEAGYESAIDLLQQSLAIDPNYAPAWTGLATVYVNQAGQGIRDYDDGYDRATEAVNRALEANPDYARAHAQLGWIIMYRKGDLAAAARQFEKAMQLAPGDIRILSNAATLLFALGRLDQTAALESFILERDPISSSNNHNIAITYLYAQRYEEAIKAAERTLQISPGRVVTHFVKGQAQLMLGDPEAALVSMQQETLELIKTLGLALVWHALSEEEKADAALAELVGQAEGFPAMVAAVYAYRGEADRAFEWLDETVKQRGTISAEIFLDPLFSGLHDDPRWSAMLERHGKSPSLLDSIEFDITLPDERQLAEAAGE